MAFFLHLFFLSLHLHPFSLFLLLFSLFLSLFLLLFCGHRELSGHLTAKEAYLQEAYANLWFSIIFFQNTSWMLRTCFRIVTEHDDRDKICNSQKIKFPTINKELICTNAVFLKNSPIFQPFRPT